MDDGSSSHEDAAARLGLAEGEPHGLTAGNGLARTEHDPFECSLPTGLVTPDHDHRAVRPGRHGQTDRTEEHTLPLAASMRTRHQYADGRSSSPDGTTSS
ncbi:hypothetical protein OG426_01280 [Streptomyces canus]|nr:hypothetical protein OG426_01280 [Streptomyces canus]